ncbi:hypothetical protein ABB02_02008 [Clostridiaceae bacterium JG1575]|nr:hypothetical protein ABB02_02008 [Clostridiaceae bacterium JG1575]
MVIAFGVFHLKLHEAHSLKEKRSVTQSLIHRIRNKFNASCSEVGLNDVIGDIEIGVCVVNSSKVVAEKQAAQIGEFIYNHAQAELIEERVELIYV